jgi:SAM-dependent methyltransferase
MTNEPATISDPPPQAPDEAEPAAMLPNDEDQSRVFEQSNGSLGPLDYLAQIREPKSTEAIAYTPDIIDSIIVGLRAVGVRVEALTLDVDEYRAYFETAGYTTYYPTYYDFNLSEKSLEHFIAAKLLELNRNDVFIDIASEHSPVPNIYTRLFGCVSYRQDLAYAPGMNVDRIGGDAAAMPIPDGFASKMALHCSFEHFEGDSDIRFIHEIGRVLRSGGKVCFTPIYLFHKYVIVTDPAVAVAEHVLFEDDAVIHSRPGWLNRHGRFYDPAHLQSRIQHNLGGMDITIYHITNASDIDPSCYIQFAAVISKQ